MHDLHWYHYLVLFFTAALAGAINSVAGGGTLLTFPALLWAHQLEIIANATNTVALWPGALSSCWGYRSELGDSRRHILTLAVPSFMGGVLGAVLLMRTSNATFAALVPLLILLATGLFVVQEPLARWQRARLGGAAVHEGEFAHGASLLRWLGVLAFQFLIGVYGGYFGAGIGILMLAAYGILGFSNIHQANGIKNLNGMFINGIAAVLFIIKGLVDWRLAALMAVGAVFGGYAGAGVARRIGQKNVRRLVIAIGLSLAASLLLRQLGWIR